jgi:hypothetical protein
MGLANISKPEQRGFMATLFYKDFLIIAMGQFDKCEPTLGWNRVPGAQVHLITLAGRIDDPLAGRCRCRPLAGLPCQRMRTNED